MGLGCIYSSFFGNCGDFIVSGGRDVERGSLGFFERGGSEVEIAGLYLVLGRV